ncbi:MAG: hypothetical protein N2515_03890 [Deltaproteobacteria bacterium]|nr:hypothetical protein [Sandaracinaceae bacterium]MCX7807727.1 hypothetical protein [Deltaproteobacteria bacterium]MDW8245326.1 hypothetical protein [Sandaracinaceae bacterium]
MVRFLVWLIVGLWSWSGCDDARHAQSVINRSHVPRIVAIVHEDIVRIEKGLVQLAERLAPRFAVEDASQRASEMRKGLQVFTRPPKGIPELMLSPLTFFAVTDEKGVVIARDLEPDPMAGQNAASMFPHVKEALEKKRRTREVVEWPSLKPEEPPAVVYVFAVPVFGEGGQFLGLVLAGAPLWRIAQRLTRQLQAEVAKEGGTIVWVYLYRGDTLHHRDTPPELDAVVPKPEERKRGLMRSPGGFTGQLLHYGRWFAYGVVPLPELGPEVGFIVWRSDPN